MSHKASLSLHGVVEPAQQIIDVGHQWRYFAGKRLRVEWLQIIDGALTDLGRKPIHTIEAGTDAADQHPAKYGEQYHLTQQHCPEEIALQPFIKADDACEIPGGDHVHDDQHR